MYLLNYFTVFLNLEVKLKLQEDMLHLSSCFSFFQGLSVHCLRSMGLDRKYMVQSRN